MKTVLDTEKFRNIDMKALVLESLFNKVAHLKACNFIKERLHHRCFPVNVANFFKNTYFEKHLGAADMIIEEV